MTDFSLLVNLGMAMLLPEIRRTMAVRSQEGVQVVKSLSLELPEGDILPMGEHQQSACVWLTCDSLKEGEYGE